MSFVENYLDFMICILRADGTIKQEEVHLFNKMLVQVGIKETLRRKYSRLVSKKSPSIPVTKTIARIAKTANQTQLGYIVRDAFAMAESDGAVAKAELDLILKLLDKAGIPKSRFPKIKRWGLEYVDHTRLLESMFARIKTKKKR